MKLVATTLAVVLSVSAATAAPLVSADNLAKTVTALASDTLEGRTPGMPGEDKTVDLLIARFKALGLQPGGRDGSWTQNVPLLRTQIAPNESIAFASANGANPLQQSRNVYLSTVRPVDEVKMRPTPMVFVGHGVHAPERGWDDFKDVDLKGKVALFLANDPDFAAAPADDAAGKFGGKRMTSYGLPAYKFEEAARRGAIAALIIHDTEGAGYDWETVIAPGGENYDLVRSNPEERVLLQGWLEGDAAAAMFKRTGQDLAEWRARARRSDFKPFTMNNARFEVNLKVNHQTVQSRNVLAKISGTARPQEVVMFGAHWDGNGVGEPDAQGRKIRAGANDNALGVAGVLEIARNFTAAKPARTLVFALWTAGEHGLLGSEAYAADPVYPVASTVANLTLDTVQTAGPSRDVVLVGDGQNTLEKDLATAAATQGRQVTLEAMPERGLFYGSDQFSLARRGVPTLLLSALGGAPDLVTGGRAAGETWLKAYAACRHLSCDRVEASWNLEGAAADIDLMRLVGADLAASTRWPEWNTGAEFKAIREQSRTAGGTGQPAGIPKP